MKDFVFDIETTGLELRSTFKIAAINHAGATEVIPTLAGLVACLKSILEAGGGIIGHNIVGYDLPLLCYHDQSLIEYIRDFDQQIFDTLHLSRLLEPTRMEHSLASWEEVLQGEKVKLDFEGPISMQDLKKRVVGDVELTRSLYQRFESQGFPQIAPYYRGVQAFDALAVELICSGIPFDEGRAKVRHAELFLSACRVRGGIVRELGDINVGSNKQIHEALKKAHGTGLPLGAPAPKTGKRAPVLNKANREAMSAKYPVVRKIFKLKEIKGVMDYVDKSNEKKYFPKFAYNSPFYGVDCIYPSYRVFSARTTRSAYSRPPINQLSKGIRELIVALPGWTMVGADISGLEYRVFAYALWKIMGNKRVWDECQGGQCPKQLTVEIFGELLNRAHLNPGETRQDIAKRVNFALLYGQSVKNLAAWLGLPESSRPDLNRAIEQRFCGVDQLNSFLKHQLSNGLLRNMYGIDIPSPEYAVLNSFIQSSASHYAKMLVALFCRRVRDHYNMRPILFNHDEIQMHIEGVVDEGVIELAKKTTEDTFDSCYGHDLVAHLEIKIGQNWGETH